MVEWLRLLTYALRSRLESRLTLEAENLVLRQQINVLVRRAAEAIAAEELGSPAAGLVVPTLSFNPEPDPDRHAGDRDPLAPSRLPGLLALEISPRRGTPSDRRRAS